MNIKSKKLGVAFYRTETGFEPVRNWIWLENGKSSMSQMYD